MPGLNIEASRLLSSLLRYSKDPEVSDVMIQAGAVPLLLELVSQAADSIATGDLVDKTIRSGMNWSQDWRI